MVYLPRNLLVKKYKSRKFKGKEVFLWAFTLQYYKEGGMFMRRRFLSLILVLTLALAGFPSITNEEGDASPYKIGEVCFS